MASSTLTLILQLISEQYMVELHSSPGRDTIFRYLADYANTLSPIWYTLDNNTNPSRFLHIRYTLERCFCLILNIMIVIRHIPLCVIRLLLHSGLYYMCIHKAMISRPNTSRILHRVRGQRRVSQAALQAFPSHTFTRMSWQLRSGHIPEWSRIPHWHHR